MTSAPTIATPTQHPAVERIRTLWPAWGWSLVGTLVVLVAVIGVSGGSPLQPLSHALTLVPYLVLVAIGQMLVITLGPGNIDVSVGTNVSMASYASVAVGAAAGPGAGLAAAVGAGLAAAACSVIAILVLRIPPIIATLATSLIVSSATLMLADANRSGAPAELRSFVNARVLGVPLTAVLVAILTVAVVIVLRRTRFGLAVVATGQNSVAAAKAGLPTRTVTGVTYLISGALAGLAGGLLAAFISPSTSLGTSYLLDSVAVVVIGGTLIAGGRPVPVGVWTGALFFVLLSGLLNLLGLSVGAQNILKGLLVVLVVVISSAATGTGRSTVRRLRASLTLPGTTTKQRNNTDG
ncbi:ABC transporter permease [Mycetocola reblochoni]|uniref:ABC transporter permease n=1 Tax=Mycetocola reblochoni TaxID=331618 RepID=A0A3L6ZL32_9MICO|nr:ABC transporter permease [Mycetocola reblochoni]RLP68547.1 ABC transporter permease [Mycetocola reblochoni]